MVAARAVSLPLFDRQERLAEDFLDHVRRFDAFGTSTVEVLNAGIPYFINEFWTARQRQAHSIHEISYRACFKAQLPAFFVENLTDKGEAVYDPFMGRGTTLVESALHGRQPLGNDINPLSKLLARPRLDPPSLIDIHERLGGIGWDEQVEIRDDLLAFYHPDTLREIIVLRQYLLASASLANEQPDPVDDWIRMVAINRLTGHSPGFFSVYSMPPNQAVTIEAQRKINLKRSQTPPYRNVAKIILKKSRSLLSGGRPPRHPPALLTTGPADKTPTIRSNSVRLIVTSPPFLDVVQYAADNWLRCWFAGIDLSSVEIAMHRTEEAWSRMVRSCFAEFGRVVEPGGYVAFEVGEVRNGKVLLERLVWEAVDHLPFQRLGVIVNQQEFTKTANCWGVSNNAKGTNTNRIVLLRRA